MESAPQSTINHNAVIEFCLRSWMAARPGRLTRRAHKTEASPAQEGDLKSAGTMPKSPPRRNVVVEENPAFLQVQAPDFAGLFPARGTDNGLKGQTRVLAGLGGAK